MAGTTPEKAAVLEEAEQKTDWEHQRIEYYRSLRYDFITCNVDDWFITLYNQQEAVFKPQKGPSWNQVRKEAGISLLKNAVAFISKEKKESLDAKKAEVRKKLQEEVDKNNAFERERCNKHNIRLGERLEDKLSQLTAHNPDVVEEYFTFVLRRDSFALDGEEYTLNYQLVYDADENQLIIDYELPEMDKVPRVKEWKVNKNNEVEKKDMKKSDYLEMYERILFDLALRTVGILFESDSKNVLSSIVFNGSCVYNDWQHRPTVLLSFVMPRSQYSYSRIKDMSCISKAEIAKLNEVRYLDDIHSEKAPSDLWETPPSKLVVPIRSSL